MSNEIMLAINKHNAKVRKYSDKDGFIVIASGSKKKRFTVYFHKIWVNRNGQALPSKYSKRFLHYLSGQGQDLDLEQVKQIMRENKRCLIKVEVSELRDSDDDVSQIEPWKFMPWGKHKYVFIDDLPDIDVDYCVWLIKTREEKRVREYSGMCMFDCYILSDKFKNRVAEVWKRIKKEKQSERLKKLQAEAKKESEKLTTTHE